MSGVLPLVSVTFHYNRAVVLAEPSTRVGTDYPQVEVLEVDDGSTTIPSVCWSLL